MVKNCVVWAYYRYIYISDINSVHCAVLCVRTEIKLVSIYLESTILTRILAYIIHIRKLLLLYTPSVRPWTIITFIESISPKNIRNIIGEIIKQAPTIFGNKKTIFLIVGDRFYLFDKN